MPEAFPTPKKAAPRQGVWRALATVAGVAVLWSAAVGWWLPGWVRPRIESAAAEALGTRVVVRDLTLNPWTLKARASGLAVGESGRELLTADGLLVQPSLESLWRLAPVIRRITLERPRLWVDREQARHFNFTPLLEKLTAPRPGASDKSARFAVFNITVHDGTVRYTDEVLHEEHRVEQLEVGIPFISSLPSDIDVDVKPLLKAQVDGAALLLSGRTLPFSQGRRSEMDLQLSGVDAAKLAAALEPLLPAPTRMDITRGRLDAQLKIVFEQRPSPAVPGLDVSGRLTVSQLAAAWPLRGLSWQWSALRVDLANVAPLEHRAALDRVSLQGLKLDMTPPPSGEGRDARRPAADSPATSSSAEKAQAASAEPWRWSVGRVQLDADALHLAPTTADWPALGAVHARVTGLTSQASARPAQVVVNGLDTGGAPWSVQGTMQPARRSAALQVKFDGWNPGPWLAAAAAPVSWHDGRVSLSAAVATDGRTLDIQDGQVQLKGVKLSAVQPSAARLQAGRAAAIGRGGDNEDRVAVPQAALKDIGASLRLPAPGVTAQLTRLSVGSVALSGLDAHASRDAQGRWLGGMGRSAGPTSVRTSARTSAPTSAPAPATASAASPEPSPKFSVAQFDCQDCRVSLDDRSVAPVARLALDHARLSLRNVSNQPGDTMHAELDTQAQGRGHIKLSADVKPRPLSVQAQVAVSGLDLRVVQSYLEPYVNVKLDAARADLNGRLTLEAGDAGMRSAGYRGRLALNGVHVLDSVNRADLLRWRTLSFSGLDAVWKPQALRADLGRVALNDFYGRVIINPQGQLNLSQVLRRSAGGAKQSLTNVDFGAAATAGASTSGASSAAADTAPPPAPAASAIIAQAAPASSPASAAQAPPPDLRWQGIALSKGRVDFTDNFVQPHYSAHLTQIDGHVSAVASRNPEPATVHVSAALDDNAPVDITGQIHPLGPRLYTDISGSATGIELTRLSTYAARYAGYAIEKGTLSMKVHYKVDQGKLEAQNQIFLDQLTFGDKVASPEATKLPVLLAVSLLKDRNGQIDVNLPISGSLDDPHFSIGGIIWRVIVNLITKAITSPFSLLAGGGSDQLSHVMFAPGSTELSPEAKKSLDTLATKLLDRPSLRLEATGLADPVADVEGLRERYVDRLMRVAKAKATDQAPTHVSIAPDERDTWLSAAYKAADIKKPRNFIGLAKSLPPDQMLALLKAAAPTDNAALLHLADRRGDVVKAYLVTKLPPERVLLTASKIVAASKDTGPGTQVRFDLH